MDSLHGTPINILYLLPITHTDQMGLAHNQKHIHATPAEAFDNPHASISPVRDRCIHIAYTPSGVHDSTQRAWEFVMGVDPDCDYVLPDIGDGSGSGSRVVFKIQTSPLDGLDQPRLFLQNIGHAEVLIVEYPTPLRPHQMSDKVHPGAQLHIQCPVTIIIGSFVFLASCEDWYSQASRSRMPDISLVASHEAFPLGPVWRHEYFLGRGASGSVQLCRNSSSGVLAACKVVNLTRHDGISEASLLQDLNSVSTACVLGFRWVTDVGIQDYIIRQIYECQVEVPQYLLDQYDARGVPVELLLAADTKRRESLRLGSQQALQGGPLIPLQLIFMRPAHGTLAELIDRGKAIPHTRKMLHDVIKGLNDLAAKGKMHRDIKPANILFNVRGQGEFAFHSDDICDEIDKSSVLDFVLADMGLCGPLAGASGFVGTLPYLATEMAMTGWGRCADIFSLGIMLFQIMFTPIFKSQNCFGRMSADVFLRSCTEFHEYLRRTLDDTAAFGLSRLCRSMLEHDPQAQPTLQVLVAVVEGRVTSWPIPSAGIPDVQMLAAQSQSPPSLTSSPSSLASSSQPSQRAS